MKRGRGKYIKIKRKAYFESKYLRVFTSTGCGLMSEALISCPAADLENSLTMNRACAMFVLWPFSLIAISNGWINLSLCRLLERKTKNKKGRKKVTLSFFFFPDYIHIIRIIWKKQSYTWMAWFSFNNLFNIHKGNLQPHLCVGAHSHAFSYEVLRPIFTGVIHFL